MAEPEKASQAEPASSTETSHLDRIEFADPEISGSGVSDMPEGEGDELDAGPALLSKDDFFAAFQAMFQFPNLLPVPPLPLQSLPIKDHERPQARAASDAIYDIALESPYLRWLIEPQSVWMQRALVISAFAGGKAMAIHGEIKSRQPAPQPQPKAQPAKSANANRQAPKAERDPQPPQDMPPPAYMNEVFGGEVAASA